METLETGLLKSNDLPWQKLVQLATPYELERLLELERIIQTPQSRSIWPDEFTNDFTGAWRFVCRCRSWNEAERQAQYMPRKEYIEEYVWHWMECMLTGQCLVTEKCRRMVISWTARMLELYQMGFGRCDQILVGEDLASAAKHVYRLKFIYEDLQSRYKDWHLPAHRELQYEGEKRLKLFALPNGSMCSYANGQSEGLQGDGVAIITMEEFGIYRNPSGMLFQAKAITMGSARAVGGFVNVITNASENKEWQRVKKPASISKGRTGIGGRDLVERGEIPLPETLR